VSLAGGIEGQEVRPKSRFVRGTVSPEIATGLPKWPQAVLVRDRVLDHQRNEPIGMCDSQAEPDGSTVVLNKEAVPIDTHEFRKALDDSSEVVEGVVERRRVWSIAVAESWVVGSHQMEVVGQASEERFVHSRGRRKSVQEEQRGRIRAAGLAVEDGELVHINGSIGDLGLRHAQSCPLATRLASVPE
jgi:hypothetical protein